MGRNFPFKSNSSAELIGPVGPDPLDPNHAKNSNLALEGFWCCPSPAVFQKTLKAHNSMHKPKPSSPPPPKEAAHRKQTPLSEKEIAFIPSRSASISGGLRGVGPEAPDAPVVSASVVPERGPRPIETEPLPFPPFFSNEDEFDFAVNAKCVGLAGALQKSPLTGPPRLGLDGALT
ncbi:hypothetical protein COP2_002915 [Malus domestica]